MTKKSDDWIGAHRGRVEYPCTSHCPDRKPGCQDHCKKMLVATTRNRQLRYAERREAARLASYRAAICKSAGTKHR